MKYSIYLEEDLILVDRKYYDLTPSQKLMYFALKFIPEKNVVNIGTAVWFHENIDCELLKAAAYKAIWRMDALRLRLKKVKGQIKQYVSEEEPKEIKIEDYSNYSKDHIDEILEKWTSTPFKYNYYKGSRRFNWNIYEGKSCYYGRMGINSICKRCY